MVFDFIACILAVSNRTADKSPVIYSLSFSQLFGEYTKKIEWFLLSSNSIEFQKSKNQF